MAKCFDCCISSVATTLNRCRDLRQKPFGGFYSSSRSVVPIEVAIEMNEKFSHSGDLDQFIGFPDRFLESYNLRNP